MRRWYVIPVVAVAVLSSTGAEAKKRAKIAKLDPTKCGRSVGDWNPCIVPPGRVVYLTHKQLDALLAVDREEKNIASR